MIDRIEHDGKLLALIVRAGFDREGVNFLTPGDLAMQLGYMHHPKGKKILAHTHPPSERIITQTCEVLIVRRGRLLANFYTDAGEFFQSRVIEAGSVAMLVSGGHGFEVLEEVEMFEVKQGPYQFELDKVAISNSGKVPAL